MTNAHPRSLPADKVFNESRVNRAANNGGGSCCTAHISVWDYCTLARLNLGDDEVVACLDIIHALKCFKNDRKEESEYYKVADEDPSKQIQSRSPVCCCHKSGQNDLPIFQGQDLQAADSDWTHVPLYTHPSAH